MVLLLRDLHFGIDISQAIVLGLVAETLFDNRYELSFLSWILRAVFMECIVAPDDLKALFYLDCWWTLDVATESFAHS